MRAHACSAASLRSSDVGSCDTKDVKIYGTLGSVERVVGRGARSQARCEKLV
jgi:hypothetical protein